MKSIPSKLRRSSPRNRLALRLTVLSVCMLCLALLIYCLARYFPQLMFPRYQTISQKLLLAWCNLTDLLPFSLLEWGILAAVWLVVGWSIRLIAERKSPVLLCSTALTVFSACVLLFVGLWGTNQFAPSFLSTTPYAQTKFTEEEAAEAGAFFLSVANYYADNAPRGEDGLTDFGSFSDIASSLDSGYDYMMETYGDRFAIGKVTPKPMAFSYIMDCLGFTGIFTAYTGEVNINIDTPAQSLPYVMSHECAHRAAVTQENDANFVAFLACIHSEDTRYQYSGWYSAFIYVYNAIAKNNKDLQSALWNSMNENLRADVLAANAHYAQFEKPVKQVAQQMNNQYLQAFNQENGIKNYGAVAGAMIAWYFAEVKPQE